jgi:Carboxypeptidase regulatory-like domain/TonB dependent receptor-like, beta-barrel
MTIVRRVLSCLFVLVAVSTANAQVQTGSIVGAATDGSGAILPGVAVTLSGERLIGGPQMVTTDTSGTYRFDRLPPGDYTVKFELQGFKTVERTGVRINAAFTATINAKLEVGAVTENITVTGESPTVDTKSNLQQTVMNQEILEGVPTGRDPWSLAKLIPGVQVSTYDVGGTQSMQQSGLSAHGSSGSDVSFNIDGATVNWPGGGGGSTMMYYDQGMFEEVNYMTSGIPAEVMAGGISINMVTKDAGNAWRGNMRYSFSNKDLQSENHLDIQQRLPSFLGNPTKTTYDANLSGGGAVLQNKVWINGTIRRWIVDKYTNTRNLDGTQALDDNTLKNYSIKGTASLSSNHKVMASYLWNDKIRGHRRNSSDLIPDIAAIVQTNPVQTTQAKYTGIFGPRLVYESSFSVMDGQTNYTYQPDTPPDAIRWYDFTVGAYNFAAPDHTEQPNSRHQFDNIFAYNTSGFGGDHFLKGGVQWARLYYEERTTVQGHHIVEYSSGRAQRVRQYQTPSVAKNIARVLGFFFQDAWSVGPRLTLNLGARFDKYQGVLPDQTNVNVHFDLFTPTGIEADGTGPWVEPRTVADQQVLDQTKGVWRAGAVYDLFGNGRTALKANYSRYALQVGIDRVTAVNPLTVGNRTCSWFDPNGDGIAQNSEIDFSTCGAFSGGLSTFYAADGVDWPYSDEVTAGIEHQLGTSMRLGAMFYYRTNRDQLGSRNTLVPPTAYTQFTVNVPNGPNGPTTATVYNLQPAFRTARNIIRDNEPVLDTEYKGVEFTAAKRFSRNWQMVAGLTFGKNEGGLGGADLNDPNNTLYPRGIIGNDSEVAFRLSGSYRLPWEFSVAGSVIANTGYPYVSSYNVTPAVASAAGVTLTRTGQTVSLSERGEERLPTVAMGDVRFSRTFRFGSRRITPQLDVFNLSNVDTVVDLQNAVGGTYLDPRTIISPRIIRVGFSLDF